MGSSSFTSAVKNQEPPPRLSLVTQSVIPASGKAEAGGSQVKGLSGVHRKFKESLGIFVKSCFKIKSKKRAWATAQF